MTYIYPIPPVSMPNWVHAEQVKTYFTSIFLYKDGVLILIGVREDMYKHLKASFLSGAHEFTPVFSLIRVVQYLDFLVMFCGPLFVF